MVNSSSPCPSDCYIPVRLSGIWLTIFTVVGAVIVIFSCVGNGVVVTAFYLKRSLRKPYNVLVANLALSDIMYCILGFPMYVIPDFHQTLYCIPEFMLVLTLSIAFVVALSLFNLFTIATERLIGIEFPFFYEAHMTTRKSYMLATSGWVMAAIIGVLISCTFRGKFIMIPYLICCTVFVANLVMYARIYHVTKRHLNRDKKYGIQNPDSKTLAAVSVAAIYIVCWLPTLIVVVIDTVVIDTRQWQQITFIFPFVNTCLNLFVYAFRMRDFREAVGSVFRRDKLKPVVVEIELTVY